MIAINLMPEVINVLGIFIAAGTVFPKKRDSRTLPLSPFFALYADPTERAVRITTIFHRGFSKMCYFRDYSFHTSTVYTTLQFPTDV